MSLGGEVRSAARETGQDLVAAARRVGWLDWSMLVLALVSIGLLLWETLLPVSETTRDWIIRADYLICALFAAEFLWRWSRTGWERAWPLRNWYEVVGMIPVADPALRGFRLFRVIRIVVLLSRFGKAADRALGEEFTYRLVSRMQNAVVEAIKGPITVAVLDEVVDVLIQGHYPRNIARALRENETEIEAMIAEKLRQDPDAGRLRRLPFYDEVVNATTRAAFRVVMEILHDPRTDEIVADLLRENSAQIRASLRERQRR
ncbi:MAG TPA: ion transporter [Nevskiaceae bacterium]|nr:ion transporter [Nevskiaceae bacterium]